MEELAALAHRYAGSAATFGATDLADRMRQLQASAQEGQMRDVAASVDELDKVIARTRNALLGFSFIVSDAET